MSYDEAQNDEVEVLVGPPGGWVAAIIVKILYISNRVNFTSPSQNACGTNDSL